LLEFLCTEKKYPQTIKKRIRKGRDIREIIEKNIDQEEQIMEDLSMFRLEIK